MARGEDVWRRRKEQFAAEGDGSAPRHRRAERQASPANVYCNNNLLLTKKNACGSLITKHKCKIASIIKLHIRSHRMRFHFAEPACQILVSISNATPLTPPSQQQHQASWHCLPTHTYVLTIVTTSLESSHRYQNIGHNGQEPRDVTGKRISSCLRSSIYYYSCILATIVSPMLSPMCLRVLCKPRSRKLGLSILKQSLAFHIQALGALPSCC